MRRRTEDEQDDRDEFGCELTREKCAATFSLIGAGRGAVRVVATTQPVWDRPSTGSRSRCRLRQDGSKQYDTTVAVGNDRDQTCAKICTAPATVCTCPPKVRHAVKLQGVPAAALKKRECELLRTAVDGFGQPAEEWSYSSPDKREDELDKSLLDLLDGKETKDKETKETKRAGDGLRAALPETLWAEAELSELYKTKRSRSIPRLSTNFSKRSSCTRRRSTRSEPSTRSASTTENRAAANGQPLYQRDCAVERQEGGPLKESTTAFCDEGLPSPYGRYEVAEAVEKRYLECFS